MYMAIAITAPYPSLLGCLFAVSFYPRNETYQRRLGLGKFISVRASQHSFSSVISQRWLTE
jgi:hypothetical protein